MIRHLTLFRSLDLEITILRDVPLSQFWTKKCVASGTVNLILVTQKKFKKVTKMRIFRIRIRKYVVSGVETLDLGTIMGKSESNEDLGMIWGQNY